MAVRIPRADDRPERDARFTLRSVTVTMAPPGCRRAEHPPDLGITMVLAEEVDPPSDQEPVSWMLLPTLSVTIPEEA